MKPWTAVVRLRAAKDNVHEFACHEGNVDVIRGILGGARAEDAAQRERDEFSEGTPRLGRRL